MNPASIPGLLFVLHVELLAVILVISPVFLPARCQTDIDECSNIGLCSNGGICVNRDGNFTCNCPAGFTGQTCGIRLSDNCSINPCGNHGNCTDLGTGQGYFCTCDPGFSGDLCSAPIDYCANVPCKNGATCTSEAQTFHCACPAGYTGSDCSADVDNCSSALCLNGGECVDGFNDYACNCTPSIYWKGEHCSEDINECNQTNPCENRGLCINHDNGFTCDCTGTGYNGTYCQMDIDECLNNDTCKNGATCKNTIGDFECDCTEGYINKTCNVPDCTNIMCQNNGQCIIGGGKWRCDCPEFIEGKYCEVRGPCADQPCHVANTLNCSQNITASTYTCLCKTGWNGTNCNLDINECDESDFCKNGGTCNNLQGGYQCFCLTEYTGVTCGQDVDECSAEPVPCMNEGVCINHFGGFSCNCSNTGYEGAVCDKDIDECKFESPPCFNGGTCHNTNGSFTCDCLDDWTGHDCQVKSDAAMQDDNIIWYIVGPAVALVLILIVIGVVWFLMCVRNKRATRGAYSPSRQEMTGARVELGNVLKKPPLERLI